MGYTLCPPYTPWSGSLGNIIKYVPEKPEKGPIVRRSAGSKSHRLVVGGECS